MRKIIRFKNLTVDNKLQSESMQGQLETVKNKYDEMSRTIDRFEQKKLPELKDEFHDIKSRVAEEEAKSRTLEQDIDQSEYKLKGLDADTNRRRQAFNDLEAHIAQMRTKKEEEKKYCQSLKNVLYEPLNNEFKYEYKKRSLFSKENEPTGRVTLREGDYKTLKEQADFGKRMKPECRKLIKGEKVQSLEKTVLGQREKVNGNRRKLSAAHKKLEKLAREKGNYKPAYEDGQAKHEDTRGFVKAVCYPGKDIFGDKNYRRIISKIDDNISPKYKEAFRNMIALDREVMIMFKQEDKKSREYMAFKNNATIKTKQEKDKGFDLKL